MNVLIYNSGIIARHAADRLQEAEKGRYKAVGFYGSEDRSSGSLSTLYSVREAEELVRNREVDALVIPNPGKQVRRILEIHSPEIRRKLLIYRMRSIRGEHYDRLMKVSGQKPWLDTCEYHVADHCNLNCRGCGHCANLYRQPSFASPASFERDLKRMAGMFEGIGLIRLFGGEPLLNPNLGSFAVLARRYFPFADIHIVTNAILLPEISQELIRVLQDEMVKVDVSLYPPMKEKKESIACFLRDCMLDYHIEEVEEFYRRFRPEGGFDPLASFQACNSSHNHLLYDGKIAACAMPFSIRKLNEVYGLNIQESGWLDLSEEGLDGEKVNEFLNRPTRLCSYCSCGLEKFKWEQCGTEDARLSDWVMHAPAAGGSRKWDRTES